MNLLNPTRDMSTGVLNMTFNMPQLHATDKVIILHESIELNPRHVNGCIKYDIKYASAPSY